MDTLHQYGELYPDEPETGQRRYVLTRLHIDCGGEVVHAGSYKHPYNLTFAAKHGIEKEVNWGDIGWQNACSFCKQSPVREDQVYLDYR